MSDTVSISSLLLRSESETLDFKRDNYTLAGGTDEQKAELLKDVVSMANAFKEADGYIVIGVAERNGRAETIMGAPPMLADHDVHQFINSKTNRPVSFSVENIEHDGKALTLIRIDKEQARPIFLKKQLGGLKKNIVYIRHGSSTAEASPDEIKEMGKDLPVRQPGVTLVFEILLERWIHQNREMPFMQPRVEEAAVLSVTAVNNGNALAQYVQGRLTVPEGVRFDSFGDRARKKSITIDFSNQVREPTYELAKPNPLEWKPLSPGMRLCLLRRKLLPAGGELKKIAGVIQWELAVDSCPLRIGEQKFNEIPIVDHR